MTLAVVSFTAAGAALAGRLADALRDAGHVTADVYAMRGRASDAPSLHDWTARAWNGDGIVFIGAAGIAVRAIAPFVRDKLTDPAVVSIDERGQFAVALLSGHAGGANALAVLAAEAVGAVPVISTATDVNGRFAADVWAREQGILLCERELAKAVSAALLAGEPVGFASDFPVEGVLPEGLTAGGELALGICVSLDARKMPFARTLHAVPRIVTVGAGCRRNTPEHALERAVSVMLAEYGIPLGAVIRLASVDLKRDEPCMRAFCAAHGLAFETASAKTLAAVSGTFSASEFVARTVGVDNVCERAAVWAGGMLRVPKRAENGVTAAAAVKEWSVRF